MDPLLAALQVDVLTAQYSRLSPSWRASDPGQPYARLYAIVGGEAEIHPPAPPRPALSHARHRDGAASGRMR
jgi:hypothetical protein